MEIDDVKPQIFKCKSCDSQFTHAGNRRHHERNIHEGLKYVCNICYKTFSGSQNLAKHKRVKHEGFVLYCPECTFTSPEKSKIIIHIKTKHEGLKFICDICGHEAGSPGGIGHHKMVKHVGRTFDCSQCSYRAPGASNLSRHISTIHEHIKFNCDECEKQLSDIGTLRLHKLRVHKVYFCDKCEYKGKDHMQFKYHKLKEYREKPGGDEDNKEMQCKSNKNCKYTCTNPENMLLHWESHKVQPKKSKIKLKVYYCDKCTYRAKCITNINNHRKKGIHIKPSMPGELECTVRKHPCSYRSTNTDHMKRHEDSHATKTLYLCDVCEYSATGHLGLLKTHSSTVHANFRHKCPSCDFTAKSRGSIRRHDKENHENVKESCDLCKFETKRLENLKKHMLTEHEGVRYNCDACSFSARSRVYIEHHKKVIHDHLRYKCNQCEHESTQIGALNQHKKRMHEGKGTDVVNELEPASLKSSKTGLTKCQVCLRLLKEESVAKHMEMFHSTTTRSSVKSLKALCRRVIRNEKIHINLKLVCSTKNSFGILKQKADKPKTKRKEHLRRKIKSRKFPCNLCEYKAQNEHALKRHKDLKHDEGIKQKCHDCSYESANQNSLKNHKEKHKGIIHQCEQCSYKSDSSVLLRHHVKYVHVKEPVPCEWPKCNYSTKNPQDLKTHQDFRHRGINYPCVKCDYKAPSIPQMQTHVQQQHDRSTIFKCEKCDHTTVNQGNLKKHILYKHNATRLECEHCEFKTITKGILHGHIKTMHKNYSDLLSKFENKLTNVDGNEGAIKLYQCPICDRYYETTAQYTTHKKHCVKRDAVVHQCSECSFIAETGRDLSKHFNRNHEQDKYVCSKCDYKTYTKGGMKRHKGLVHKEGDLLKCSNCDYKTAAGFILRQHIQSNHENVVFKCKTCDSEVKTGNYLKRHMKSVYGILGKKKPTVVKVTTSTQIANNTNSKFNDSISPANGIIHPKIQALSDSLIKPKENNNGDQTSKSANCLSNIAEDTKIAIQGNDNQGGYDRSKTELTVLKDEGQSQSTKAIKYIEPELKQEIKQPEPEVVTGVSPAVDDTSVMLLFARAAGGLVRAQEPGMGQERFGEILARVWREMPEVARQGYRDRAREDS